MKRHYISLMRWYNVNRDELPAHGQEVLISYNGVYYLVSYDSTLNKFRLKEEPDSYFDIGENTIYWTEFHSPSE